MTANWKMLGLPVVLGSALLAASAARAQTDGPPAGDQRVDLIGTKLKALEDDVRKLQTDSALRAEKLQSDINELRKLLVPNTSVSNYPSDPARALAEMKAQLEAMRQDIEALRRALPYTAAKVTEPTAYVRLMNLYPDEMTIMVNQNAYRLLPGERRDLTVPAGPLTYQVLRVDPIMRNRTLVANETRTITVEPLR